MNIDTSAKRLETHANLKSYSVGRYSKAIDTILNNPEFQKNNKGNRIYITALKHLIQGVCK